MTFEEDLIKRRIDVAAFAAGDPEKFAAWQLLYQQVHPNTFYTAVKMIINDVRRRFWLAEAPKPIAVPTAAAVKPVVRRATATIPSTASAIPDEPSPSVDRTPEPAPRPRAVIRRPPVGSAAVPEEKESVEEKPSIPENEGITPETPKSRSARPVFRRTTNESTANSASENQKEPENKTSMAPEKVEIAAEIPKLPRPRPVIRKPTTPATTITEATATRETPAEVNAIPLPEHSNPNPTEMPKPPRPRPVIKRAAPTTPGLLSENPVAELKSETDPATAPETPATEALKPPRPRPVFKRPAQSSITASELNINLGQELVNPASTGQEQVVNKSEAVGEEASTPEIPAVPPTFKPPRPRPVFKRPAKPELPDDTIDNSPEKE